MDAHPTRQAPRSGEFALALHFGEEDKTFHMAKAGTCTRPLRAGSDRLPIGVTRASPRSPCRKFSHRIQVHRAGPGRNSSLHSPLFSFSENTLPHSPRSGPSCPARSSPRCSDRCDLSCCSGCRPGDGSSCCPRYFLRYSAPCSPRHSDDCGLSCCPGGSIRSSDRCSADCLVSRVRSCPPNCSVGCFPDCRTGNIAGQMHRGSTHPNHPPPLVLSSHPRRTP